jgi:phage head maturation protease
METKAKKELKKYINDNGFFLQLDKVEKIERNNLSNKNIPKGDNVLIFEGTASQSFATGESSRNGYKIDVDGWNLENYLKNSQILLSHDPENPIGKAFELSKSENGLTVKYWIDLTWMDDVNASRVKGGAYSGLSTGHITRNEMFEDQEGKRYNEQELIDDGVDLFDLYFGYTDFIPVVTKAELLEISLVTLPSNPDALTMQNSLQNYFTNKMTNQKPKEVEKTSKAVEKTEVNKVETNEVSEKVETLNNALQEANQKIEELKELSNQNSDVMQLVENLTKLVVKQGSEIEKLENAFDQIPQSKAVKFYKSYN